MFQFMFTVQLLVKFRFFIQELWERKSLQILYECWRRAYHALLAQLFFTIVMISYGCKNMNARGIVIMSYHSYLIIDLIRYLSLFTVTLSIQFKYFIE